MRGSSLSMPFLAPEPARRSTFAWCSVPVHGRECDETQLFFYRGMFNESDFVNYYIDLAQGLLVVAPEGTECTHVIQLPCEAVDKITGAEQLWQCVECNLMKPHMKKCGGGCFVRYCSDECSRKDWRNHKPMCKALAEWTKTYQCKSRKSRKTKTLIVQRFMRSSRGMGYQFLDEAEYWGLVRHLSVAFPDPEQSNV